MSGPVERYLLHKIRSDGAIHLTLIDPENNTPTTASQLAKDAEVCRTTAIMVGGSTSTSTAHLDNITRAIKRSVKIPIILFPSNVSGISRYADAIWFMSLLNSLDPYFLVGAQVLGAPMVKRYKLETLPMGYIIVGEGGAAGVVGRAIPIPYSKPELAAGHALAAQYLGMHFVYLEGGSGASHPVPSTMINAVKHIVDIPLIVGGGIRNSQQAQAAVSAGADIIVTGNALELAGSEDKLAEFVATVKRKRTTVDLENQ